MRNDQSRLNRKFNLIVLGTQPFETLERSAFRTRGGQLISQMVSDERFESVIYVNPYYYQARLLSLAKNLLYNIVRGGFVASRRVSRKFRKITVLNLVNLKRVGVSESSFMKLFKRCLSGCSINQTKRIVLWLYYPAESGFFSLVPGAIKVFDTLDNWIETDWDTSKYPWYNKQKVIEGYRTVAAQDVLIISNGSAMTSFYSQFREGGRDVLTVTNGVNTEMFSSRGIKSLDLPGDISGLKKPIVGYVGVIQERFDLDLFRFIVKNNPDITFVIVGKIKPFKSFEFNLIAPNLKLLGFRPYSLIPAYINSFDVCIVPHRHDSLVKYMSPMKIYEYLAMGKPVVTTTVQGAEDVSEFCLQGSDPATFSRLIGEALTLDNSKAARYVADHHSWSSKVNCIVSALESGKVSS